MHTNSTKKERKPAQIMVITLLTMMILGIITIGVASNSTRDVQQSVNSRQFEELYDISEERVFTIVDKYSKISSVTGNLYRLDDLMYDYPTNCQEEIANRKYKCTFVLNNEIQSEVNIEDIATFEDYEIFKDEMLLIDLAGYTSEIRMTWEGQAAIDLALVYTVNATGEYKVIRDLFDMLNVVDASGGNEFGGTNHPFRFSTYENPNTNSFRFTISNINGFIAASDASRYLAIIPRIDGDNGSIKLSFGANAGLKDQMRSITATSFVIGVVDSPVPSVRTVIPLFPQVPSMFTYSLLVDDQVRKELPYRCGNGIIEFGEECDGAANCDAQCRFI